MSVTTAMSVTTVIPVTTAMSVTTAKAVTTNIINTTINNDTVLKSNHSFCCNFCQLKFISKNKLFQHFRNNLCYELNKIEFTNSDETNPIIVNNIDNNNSNNSSNKNKIYYNDFMNSWKTNNNNNNNKLLNTRQSVMLTIAYNYNISTINNNETVLDDILINIISKFNKDNSNLLNLSRASCRKFRVSQYLQHDNIIGSLGDVIIYSEPYHIHPLDNSSSLISSSSSSTLTTTSSSSSSSSTLTSLSLSEWVKKINIEIEKSLPNQIYIISKQIIPKVISSLHAEQHYTTKTYDYILPLSYFDLMYSTPATTPTTFTTTTTTPTYNNNSSGEMIDNKLIMKQKIKKILRLIIGEKLSNKGGYKW